MKKQNYRIRIQHMGLTRYEEYLFGYRFEVLQISNSYYTYRYLTNLYRDSFALRASLAVAPFKDLLFLYKLLYRYLIFLNKLLNLLQIFNTDIS